MTMLDRIKCDRCGRFISKVGSSAMRYGGFPPTPDHEDFRCVPCTEKYGALSD